MDLEAFRVKVQHYRQFTGKTQEALAKEGQGQPPEGTAP
jgi:hypothetical protein